jgi:DNA-binding Lrp family transcriptional regulator
MYLDRVLLSISAELSFPSLGMEPVLYFMESPFRSVASLELALDVHPYTRYRVRSLGTVNGLYALFAVPEGTGPLLNEFIEELVRLGHVADYYQGPSMGPWAYSETDFRYFDIKTGRWGFDWDLWEADVFADSSSRPAPDAPPPSVLHELDERDMRILRQLTINAARRKTDIALEAKVPNYHLSRRWRKLEEGVIDSYRVVINREASKLFATLMFDCRCTENVKWKFANAVGTLPYQSTLIPSTDGFFLQTSLPSLDIPHLGRVLQMHCAEVGVLWSDYDSSMRYWFWDEPFRDGEWVSSREFMVDYVIEVLEESMEGKNPPIVDKNGL